MNPKDPNLPAPAPSAEDDLCDLPPTLEEFAETAVKSGGSLDEIFTDEVWRAKLAAVLPKNVGFDAFLAAARSHCQRPEMAKARAGALAACVAKAATMGLLLDGRQAVIVMFGDAPQVLPTYRGLLDLLYATGKVVSCAAEAVYEGDEFAVNFGEVEVHRRRFSATPPKDREAVAFYFRAKMADGSVFTKFMEDCEVREIRGSRTSAAWDKYYSEMGCKTVLKRALKTLPQTPQLSAALLAANLAEGAPDGAFDGGGAAAPEAPVAPEESGGVAGAQKKAPTGASRIAAAAERASALIAAAPPAAAPAASKQEESLAAEEIPPAA
jgi:phage RecT family recombinase